MSCKLFYLMVICVLLFTVDGLGQITTKDGLRIEFFIKDNKKPLTKEELENGIEGALGRYERLIDKVVIYKGKELFPSVDISVKIYEIKTEYKDNENKELEPELILNKRIQNLEFTKKKPTYTIPIYPLIDYDSKFKIIVTESDNVLIELNYQILWWSGH
ncbi:MAG: hypothetical protein ACK5DB_06185 [Ignavibacteria bacterium]